MRAPCVAILGHGRGTGIACARKFQSEGWSVMIIDGDHKNLDKAKSELGESVGYLHEDQTTRLGLKNALSGTLEQFDSVDTVIHIPPEPTETPFLEMDSSVFAKDLERTTLAAFMSAHVFGAEMARELKELELHSERPPYPKSILQVLGIYANGSDPGAAGRSITQGAILPVMRALSVELAPHRIRSNAIIALRGKAGEDDHWIKERTPIGRSSKPSEIAHAAYYLASPEANAITGQALTLDGGRSGLNGILDV